MIINIKTSHVTDSAKSQLETYGAEKFMGLENKLLKTVEDDSVVLDLNLEHVQKHNAFILKVNLQVPGKTIHHEQAKHVLTECIDLAYENVKEQLAKHMEHFHNKRGIHHKASKDLPETESDNEAFDY